MKVRRTLTGEASSLYRPLADFADSLGLPWLNGGGDGFVPEERPRAPGGSARPALSAVSGDGSRGCCFFCATPPPAPSLNGLVLRIKPLPWASFLAEYGSAGGSSAGGRTDTAGGGCAIAGATVSAPETETNGVAAAEKENWPGTTNDLAASPLAAGRAAASALSMLPHAPSIGDRSWNDLP